MSQITIYLPEGLESEVRRRAKAARKSVSAYFADLAKRTIAPSRWPKGFDALFGAWEGPFPEPEDPLPEDEPRL